MTRLDLIAHDIRSRENVGALFRLCDSLGVNKLWLTGYTPAPPDGKISKVALGAERSVPFEKIIDIQEVFARMKRERIPVIALELTDGAVPLESFDPSPQLALLVGTETTGIPPSLLSLCDGAVKIEQRGVKESLNVSVAAGIACWACLRTSTRG